jgi:type IV secretory pathway VirB4 component
MAAASLALTHYVVWAPQSAAGDGIPHHSSLHRAAMAPTAGRSAAERMLESALRLARDRGITATAATADEVGRLIGRESVLAADEAAATREGLWITGAHVAILTVSKLPPDVDYGVVVEALQRARARGLVSLHLIPTRAEAVRKALRQQRGAIRHALQQGRGEDVDLTVALDDIRQLEGALAERRVSGLRVAISIAVRAPTQSACAEARERLEALLVGYGFQVVHPTVPGFVPAMAMAPGTAPLRRALHLTTDAVAARLLPILGTPFADVEAPLVGRNLRTGASAYLSVWSRRNFNVACVGSSGAGKSTTTKLWLVRHCMQGANAVVLDPDSEYEGVIGLLGGRYHELADSAINPLGFGGSLDCDDAAEIMVAVLSVMGGETVAYAAGRPVRRLPGEDKAWLHQELVAFLAAWRTARGREEPVLSALLEHLGRVSSTDRALSDSQRDRYQRICQRLSGYCHGSMGRIFDRPSSFRLEAGIPVGIGFRSLSMRYASDPTPAIAVVLSHVLEAMSLKRERLIVLVEEAHVLTSDPDAGQVLEQLVRRARKSRAGVWMASQRIEEFIATDLGRTLAATAATKIVLGHEDTVADRVREVFELADDEAAALTPPVAGQAVLISGEERTVVQIMPSPVLWPWVRTDEEAQNEGSAA